MRYTLILVPVIRFGIMVVGGEFHTMETLTGKEVFSAEEVWALVKAHKKQQSY